MHLISQKSSVLLFFPFITPSKSMYKFPNIKLLISTEGLVIYISSPYFISLKKLSPIYLYLSWPDPPPIAKD